MKQSTKRFLSILLGLTFLLGSFLMYFEFIQPAYENAQSIKAQILSLEQFLNTEKAAIDKVQNLITSYKGQGGVQDAVSAVLPLSNDDIGALGQIYGLAGISGLAFQTVAVVSTPSPVAVASASPTIVVKPAATSLFRIRLVGSYESLKVFLMDLENNMRVFDLRSISVQQDMASASRFGSLIYSYDLSIAAYSQTP